MGLAEYATHHQPPTVVMLCSVARTQESPVNLQSEGCRVYMTELINSLCLPTDLHCHCFGNCLSDFEVSYSVESTMGLVIRVTTSSIGTRREGAYSCKQFPWPAEIQMRAHNTKEFQLIMNTSSHADSPTLLAVIAPAKAQFRPSLDQLIPQYRYMSRVFTGTSLSQPYSSLCTSPSLLEFTTQQRELPGFVNAVSTISIAPRHWAYSEG